MEAKFRLNAKCPVIWPAYVAEMCHPSLGETIERTAAFPAQGPRLVQHVVGASDVASLLTLTDTSTRSPVRLKLPLRRCRPDVDAAALARLQSCREPTRFSALARAQYDLTTAGMVSVDTKSLSRSGQPIQQHVRLIEPRANEYGSVSIAIWGGKLSRRVESCPDSRPKTSGGSRQVRSKRKWRE